MSNPTFFEVQIYCSSEYHEILSAELSEVGFQSFWEEETILRAYIQQEDLDNATLNTILTRHLKSLPEVHIALLEDKNWNEEWEKHFDPILIENQCYVRATFHAPLPNIPLDICIDPKMSFGTGHHATTYMMVQHLLTIKPTYQRVIDAGCGSGILAIVAEKLGAAEILAFDIEDWAFQNALENIDRNDCKAVTIKQGTIETVATESGLFNVILANITKNILLSEKTLYHKHLNNGGILVLSGFYETDIPEILQAFTSFKFHNQIVRNNWASLVLVKNE